MSVTKKELEDAMKVIMRGVNGKEIEVAEVMAEVVMSDHRTLQQNFCKSLQRFVDTYSSATHDLRNEASVEWAKEAVKANENHYLPTI